MFVTLTTVWFRKVALKMWSVGAGAGMPPVCLLSQQGKCRNGEWALRNSHSTLTLLQHPGVWQVDGCPCRLGTSLAMTKLTWVSSVLRNTKLGLHRRGFGKCWFHASYFPLSFSVSNMKMRVSVLMPQGLGKRNKIMREKSPESATWSKEHGRELPF